MPAGKVHFTNKMGASKMGDEKMEGGMKGKMGSYAPAEQSGKVYNSHDKSSTTDTSDKPGGGY